MKTRPSSVRFSCPGCGQPSTARWSAGADWQCPRCDHWLRLPAGPGPLEQCVVCDNPEMYRKKDFPHALGLTILTVAAAAFLLGNYLYHQWWAWAVLIGSAVADGLLYLLVGDVIVCYRCGAQYRGVGPQSAFHPFDLGVAERYRQEKARREQLRAEARARERPPA